MALKGDRVEHLTDISFFMSASTAERGYIVVHDTGGSGAAMDDGNALVKLPTAGISGTKPAGLLLNDVVNLDLTRQHYNMHKDEVQLGGKVTLLRRGTVVTNAISGTPTIGAQAYYNNNGQLSATNFQSNSTQVGRFLSLLDADGYCKVEINIV